MGKTPEDTENEETPKKTLKVATKVSPIPGRLPV